jgi:hypothetical protein
LPSLTPRARAAASASFVRREIASRSCSATLVKALARAFRWKRILESGEFATIAELAEREGIAPSYMTRVLRLTLLAPDIVEAILDGTQGPEVTLARVLEPFPIAWDLQVQIFRQARPKPPLTIAHTVMSCSPKENRKPV